MENCAVKAGQTADILTVKNLNAYYTDSGTGIKGGRKRRQILFDVSFSMREGEIRGLVGESGSGKSTLVKTLLGINKEYNGEITHHSTLPQMVFQDPYGSLNPSKKIGWILEEPLRLQGGHNKADRREKVMHMLLKVGLDEKLADRYPRQLSGGQRQRVGIAGALMLKPRLLIADEPVSALDVTIQAQILDLLLSLHEEMGLSILFISHDLRVVYQMCERIMIMHHGVICEEGPRSEIIFAPKTDYAKSLLRAAGLDTFHEL